MPTDIFGREIRKGDWIITATNLYSSSAAMQVGRVFRVTTDPRGDKIAVTKEVTYLRNVFRNGTIYRTNHCLVIDPSLVPKEYHEKFKDWKPEK